MIATLDCLIIVKEKLAAASRPCFAIGISYDV
jgi:hypothetical protein